MHHANVNLMLTYCKLLHVDLAIVIVRYDAKVNKTLNYYLQVNISLFNLTLIKSSD